MLALPVKVPADAIALWRWGTEIDVRDILPAIHVPTLVLQRTGDRWVKPEEGRYLATHIEGARYVELAGRDHVIWGEDCDGLIDKIRDFVIGAPPPARAERVLISVLALAIDGAADDAKAAGQADIVRDGLLLGGGTEIRRSRDTLLAAFQRPTRSIECAMRSPIAWGHAASRFARRFTSASARRVARIFPASPSKSRRGCWIMPSRARSSHRERCAT